MRLLLKTLIGLGAHGQLFAIAFFLGVMVPRMVRLFQSQSRDLPPDFVMLMPVVFIACFLSLFSLIFFILYLVKNSKFTQTQQTVWILLMFFVGILAEPILFWVVFIKHPGTEPLFSKSPKVVQACPDGQREKRD